MKPVLLFLIDGFEEIEALATVDVLRRAGIGVKTVSLTGSRTVTGNHHIPVTADTVFEDVDTSNARMLVIPGGTPAFNGHEGLRRAVADFHSAGGSVAAICASPMVLGTLGILRGRRATCYPGFEGYLEGAVLATDQPVVVDGNVVTGRGPGLTLDFALTLVGILAGEEKRAEVARQILVE